MSDETKPIEPEIVHEAEMPATAMVLSQLKRMPRSRAYIKALVENDDPKEVYRILNEQITAHQLALHEQAFAELEIALTDPNPLAADAARERYKEYILLGTALAKHRAELFKSLGMNLLPPEADKTRSLYAPKKQLNAAEWQEEYKDTFKSFTGKVQGGGTLPN